MTDHKGGSIRDIVGELNANWRVLLAATLGTSLGIPATYYYTVGLFLNPIRAEFGWSASAISITTTVVIATMAIMSPLVGKLVDRVGALRVGVCSLLWFAAGLWMLSLSGGVFWHYLAVTALLALGGSATSAVCFVRMLVTNFDKARGTAIGIALAGIGVCVTIVPQFTAGIIATQGWRSGYRFLAILLLVAAPIVFLLGRGHMGGFGETSANAAAEGLSVREAMRRRAFWLMAAAFFTSAAAVGGSIISFIPFLVRGDLPMASAVRIASILGIALIFGRIVTGLLLDRVSATRVAAAFFIAGGAGCACFFLTGSPLAGLAAGFLLGAAMGAEVDIAGYLTAQYFGVRNFSAIYGWQYAIFSVGASLGPLVVGVSIDQTGSHLPAVGVFIALLLLAFGLMLVMPRPGSPR